MKKFFSGVIVGACLFMGASAFADGGSLIGQKVQGLFSVEKSGEKVADAVVINGSAYAPVRAVSDATGTDLKVDGKKIIIQEKGANQPVAVKSQEEADAIVQEARVQRQIERYTGAARTSKEEISKFQALLSQYEAELANAKTESDVRRAQESIDYIKTRLKAEQEILAEAEAKLAELQGQ